MDCVKKLTVEGASCSLWLEDTPQVAPYKTASIGQFECNNAASGQNILQQACIFLRQKGFGYLIGPMDQNTWHGYRFVTASDNSPPFFLEPQNPAFYPRVFLQQGFAEIGHYSSAIDHHMNPKRTDKLAERFKSQGFTITAFNPDAAEAALADVHALSLRAFAHNFLYTPIAQPAFMALYQPLLPMLNPRYVLLARDAQAVLKAFLFAVPNYAEGTSPKQLIIKTYASLHAGLGGLLVEEVMRRARQDGYKAIIHALMHDNNPSMHRSRKYGQPFRRYTLYGRRL